MPFSGGNNHGNKPRNGAQWIAILGELSMIEFDRPQGAAPAPSGSGKGSLLLLGVGS